MNYRIYQSKEGYTYEMEKAFISNITYPTITDLIKYFKSLNDRILESFYPQKPRGINVDQFEPASIADMVELAKAFGTDRCCIGMLDGVRVTIAHFVRVAGILIASQKGNGKLSVELKELRAYKYIISKEWYDEKTKKVTEDMTSLYSTILNTLYQP